MVDEAEQLLNFPCRYPIKVMGQADGDFAQTMLAIVLRHAPEFDPASVEMRTSSGARYISLTFDLVAESREQLDLLYRELTAHPAVKVVL